MARPPPRRARPAHAPARGSSSASGAAAAVQTKPSSSTGMPAVPRGERRAHDRRKLAPAQCGGHLQRVAERGLMQRQALLDAAALRFSPASSTPVPRPTHFSRHAAEQRRRHRRRRRRVADAHLAEAGEVGVLVDRRIAGRHGLQEIRLVHRRGLREVACQTLDLQRHHRSSAPAARASWLIAAPPAAKFATIWCVTSAGKADTPCAVTPCDPANTTTCTLSSLGIARPCQRASHAAISSSRPRLPCGLVSVSWRARAALAAASSPGQRSSAGRAVIHPGI